MDNCTNLIDYKYLEYPIIRCLSYGDLSRINLVVLCQHGFNSKEFMEYFPHLISSFKDYPSNIIFKYLDIEYDFAARMLAVNLAKILSTKFNVLFIGVNCDRGIMDANRLPKYCVSSFINNLGSFLIAKCMADFTKSLIFYQVECF